MLMEIPYLPRFSVPLLLRPLSRRHGQRPLEHYLQKSRFLETEETPANDDVIQEIDLKNFCSGH
jgi:hypothetical protein